MGWHGMRSQQDERMGTDREWQATFNNTITDSKRRNKLSLTERNYFALGYLLISREVS